MAGLDGMRPKKRRDVIDDVPTPRRMQSGQLPLWDLWEPNTPDTPDRPRYDGCDHLDCRRFVWDGISRPDGRRRLVCPVCRGFVGYEAAP